MASVHLGRLLGHAGFARTVAIKRLHPQYAEDPEFVAMLLDEARLVARIRHPNVVPTLDVAATDGELFLVMEYVQGESLSALVRASAARGEPIDPGIATTLLAGVLHGLHSAHEARGEQNEPLGIVHRDVSPQNVLVGADGVARVLDFGIAKAANRVQTTKEGQLKGKVAYMAPEQLDGVTSPATDVYAASAVLWETLTSRRLFSGESDPAVLKLVLEGRIDPPSRHAPGVPKALDALVLRGLSAWPEDRFPSAEAMALALENVLPPVPASRIGAWVALTAKDALTLRSQRLALIEGESQKYLRDMPGPQPEVPTQPMPAGLGQPPEEVRTQLTTGVSKREIAVGEVPRRRGKQLAVAVAAAAVALGVLALVGRSVHRSVSDSASSRSSRSNTVAPQAPPLLTAAVPVLPESPPPVEPPAAPARAVTPAPAAAESSSKPIDRATQHGVRAAPTPARKPAPAAAQPCVPPYYFDAEGNRVFKKECL
jgi:eukaryotic-like serine/threonine-protein kinase